MTDELLPAGHAAAGVRYAGIGDEAGASLADQIEAHTRLGWTAFELRSVDGTAVADLDDDAFRAVRTALADADLSVVCVDSRIGNWSRPIGSDFGLDLEELGVLERRCAQLGTGLVRIMSYPSGGRTDPEWGEEVIRRIRVLAARARAAGLVLVHENCAGWAGRDPSRMLRLVEAVDSPALGLLFDIGNGPAYGYDARELLPALLAHVRHVHVKDARGAGDGTVYTMPGEGHCRVAECLRLLLAHGYHGTWSIEPHLAVRPHEGLQDAGPGGVDAFVAYGRALERLVRDEVLVRTAGAAGPAGGR